MARSATKARPAAARKPKAGLVGFTVSDLRLPGQLEPWEPPADEWIGSPARIATALDIMIDGPLGGAAFNNEFGRPAILGYFRTFEHAPEASSGIVRGYHKPVMLAGGIGAIRPAHVAKAPVPAGAALIVLGGPAFLIGLGGGAASSLAQGASAEDLDFASVQRDNAEIERRCQEVIDRCWAQGDAQSDPVDPRRRRRRPVERDARARPRRRPRRDARAARDPDRRTGSVAARAVVQRSAGALRARDRAPTA